MAYVNSRGDEEEHIMTLANAIHIEEHLTDLLSANPNRSSEIAPLLDKARRNRQELVKTWCDNGCNSDWWCKVKHSVSQELHYRELIANASRDNPDQVEELSKQLQNASSMRKTFVGKFLSGKGDGDSKEECHRCVADLKVGSDIEDYSKTVSIGETQSKDDMYIWIAFFGLLLFIALMAQHQANTNPA